MGDTILETENVRKEFDGLVAVDDVSLAVEDDQLCSIIGPNGAGKTTFFNLLTGALKPTSGTVMFRNENITDAGPADIADAGLIRSYQITQLFEEISAVENVSIAIQPDHSMYNFWKKTTAYPEVEERALEILDRLDLEHKADELPANMSHGEQRTLELAVTLGADPDMLLLDEPTAGMSSDETNEMIKLVNDLAADLPIVLVEHKMSVVMSVSDRIVVLHDGRKIADGPSEEVRADEEVQRVYLGKQ